METKNLIQILRQLHNNPEYKPFVEEKLKELLGKDWEILLYMDKDSQNEY